MVASGRRGRRGRRGLGGFFFGGEVSAAAKRKHRWVIGLGNDFMIISGYENGHKWTITIFQAIFCGDIPLHRPVTLAEIHDEILLHVERAKPVASMFCQHARKTWGKFDVS